MKLFDSRPFKSEFIRNVLTLVSGTTFAQALPILISPILSRIYTPENFGVFALYTSMVTIFVVIATGQYHIAVMLPKSDRTSVNILMISTLLAAGFFILLTPVTIIFKDELADFFKESQFAYWIFYFPAGMLLLGLFRAFTYWFGRYKKYRFVAMGTVGLAFVTSGMNLVFGFGGYGTGGLVYSHLFGLATAVIIFSFLIILEVLKGFYHLILQSLIIFTIKLQV